MTEVYVVESGYFHQCGATHSVYKNYNTAMNLIRSIIEEGNKENIKTFEKLSDEDKEYFQTSAVFRDCFN